MSHLVLVLVTAMAAAQDYGYSAGAYAEGYLDAVTDMANTPGVLIVPSRPGYAWVEPYFDAFGRRHEGYWREAVRPGYTWVTGYYSVLTGVYVPGYWQPNVVYVAPIVVAAPPVRVVAPAPRHAPAPRPRAHR